MIEQLLQENPPVVSRIDEPTPDEVIATFDQHLPDGRQPLLPLP